ncbi:tryptophan synthase beta subunit-like PLP-dependent enzyme [Aspergillus pseudotamarii]|uniref:tryptophan synthase n=1 Tax=Aspergillus pseudotamarii TaxID=132259 RepID=A0A5N6SL10_ASPPS|nr:tryptophan synthase beta subunit-like PLP-dependent enzyme [Aspergillus pseudotamarii]KAE8134450.1 tryptophan synthase beta subunit-like PLP-dependent enzyme [Aspergillus pseudotamarii]
MEGIKQTFTQCKEGNRPTFVTFVRAGFPTVEEAVDITLGLEAGGAGMKYSFPFTDPFADGPTIQTANTVQSTLGMVTEAQQTGLRAPVLLMGYYNTLLSHGEEQLPNDCRATGVNGLIVIDLPPHKAVKFRNLFADSFVYIVSRMGVTGATGTLNADLPQLLKRTKQYNGNVPIAVGFGVSTRDHFLSVASIADGVVISSRIITTLTEAAPGDRSKPAEEYCAGVWGRRNFLQCRTTRGVGTNTPVHVNGTTYSKGSQSGLLDEQEAINSEGEDPKVFPAVFGEFGGSDSPELLMSCLSELEAGFEKLTNDPEPGHLHVVGRLTEQVGGATIWLKREDLNHTGSHKINNVLGKVLLARRLGKTEIITQTRAGMHGEATATVCARFNMKCTVLMGAEDIRRQALNGFTIKLLGAEAIPVEAGSKTLRDAVDESFRVVVAKVDTAYHILGSAIGPHPFPTIARTFQTVIGDQTKTQMLEQRNKPPDAVVACIGRASNHSGMFYPFINDPSVKLLGVEAGDDGLETKKHAATLIGGTKGHGQIQGTHSISAGLSYAGAGDKDVERVADELPRLGPEVGWELRF